MEPGICFRVGAQNMKRREFLSAAVGLALSRTSRSWHLGAASYSLRKLSRADAIDAIRTLKTPYVNIKSFHLPYETTRAERAAARAEFEKAGLTIVGGGTIYLEKTTTISASTSNTRATAACRSWSWAPPRRRSRASSAS